MTGISDNVLVSGCRRWGVGGCRYEGMGSTYQWTSGGAGGTDVLADSDGTVISIRRTQKTTENDRH